MNKETTLRDKILNQASYWVEGVNMDLYDALVSYKEKHLLNNTQLARHLGISKGRLSQILNDGEINFSLEKLFEIALKIGKYPNLQLIAKEEFEKDREKTKHVIKPIIYQPVFNFTIQKKEEVSYTVLKPQNEFKKRLELN